MKDNMFIKPQIFIFGIFKVVIIGLKLKIIVYSCTCPG